MEKIFVTGIDTNVGKTVASAILVKALSAAYWKPIQCGDLEKSDTQVVQSLVRDSRCNFYPEAFRLSHPLSPNQAAKRENKEIVLKDLVLPPHQQTLIIEGAGGIMVPFNERENFLDWVDHFKIPVVVVSKNYLGSLNHTLLTIEALKNRRIPILGLIFNGPVHLESEDFLLEKTQVPLIGKIRPEICLASSIIDEYAESWRPRLEEALNRMKW